MARVRLICPIASTASRLVLFRSRRDDEQETGSAPANERGPSVGTSTGSATKEPRAACPAEVEEEDGQGDTFRSRSSIHTEETGGEMTSAARGARSAHAAATEFEEEVNKRADIKRRRARSERARSVKMHARA